MLARGRRQVVPRLCSARPPSRASPPTCGRPTCLSCGPPWCCGKPGRGRCWGRCGASCDGAADTR
eukprot:6312119-Alexandrium_andersonii.AAC.1